MSENGKLVLNMPQMIALMWGTIGDKTHKGQAFRMGKVLRELGYHDKNVRRNGVVGQYWFATGWTEEDPDLKFLTENQFLSLYSKFANNVV